MTLGSSEKSCTSQNLEAVEDFDCSKFRCLLEQPPLNRSYDWIRFHARMHLLLQDATARIVPHAFQSDQVRILPLA